MEDLDYAKKLLELTQEKKIKWEENSTLQNRKKYSFKMDTDKVVIDTYYYDDVDYEGYMHSYLSYRICIYDNKNYCYKAIKDKQGSPIFLKLEKLYDEIESTLHNFDQKAEKFFSSFNNK